MRRVFWLTSFVAAIVALSASPARAGVVGPDHQRGRRRRGHRRRGNAQSPRPQLSFLGTQTPGAEFLPISGHLVVGPTPNITTDIYSSINDPSSLGPGTTSFGATSGSGDRFGITPTAGFSRVPQGSVSGSPLSATNTYASTTILGLGLTPGTYSSTWGTGPTADFFTVQIGVTAIPEPSPLALAGVAVGMADVVAWRRRAGRTAVD